jgi:hypothetical protein
MAVAKSHAKSVDGRRLMIVGFGQIFFSVPVPCWGQSRRLDCGLGFPVNLSLALDERISDIAGSGHGRLGQAVRIA